MNLAQFKVRRLNGVTEVRMADDRQLREELARNMAMYAPLISEQGRPEPTFDSLKGIPEVSAFLATPEGQGCTVTLQVRGTKQAIIEKAVLFADGAGAVRAVSKWTPEGGIEFSKPD